ncbi:MAG: DUF3656 domain-containing protein [Defluviitaleaceae bacterium]|nr:DUF3656 domain-containing protein [Defluviitaleaceae bacterium]
MKTPELLSPAGSIESAMAAINAGADAIYLGGKNFSARSFAQNFSNDEIVSIIEYAALRGVAVYVAVNTLIKDAEIPTAVDFVREMHGQGAAAFILQDAGLAYIIKTKLPGVEIHASTQMTAHSSAGAKYLAGMGFSRVILSRELSLGEVAEIVAETQVDCEVFAHGALCVGYSGQCLMSSMIGGRSGNRGKCAQICRTSFELLGSGKSGYLLSPKDMMTLDILGEIAAAGVRSLKIEGRMKGAEYVYLATAAYRRGLDEVTALKQHCMYHCSSEAAGTASVATKPASNQIVQKQPEASYCGHGSQLHSSKDTPSHANNSNAISTISRENPDITKQNLLQIFNRGGSFSAGYYKTHSGEGMISAATPKSSGVLVGEVVSYKNDRCKIAFHAGLLPGDGIEIWTTNAPHVGTGISKKIPAGTVADFQIKGAIKSGNKVYKSHDKALIDDTRRLMAVAKKLEITGTVQAVAGKPLRLAVTFPGTDAPTAKALGEAVEPAKNAPMHPSEIIAQLSKTGDTPFNIRFSHADIDDGIFVSKSALNKLRRQALANLEAAVIASIKRPITPAQKNAFPTIQPSAPTSKPQALHIQIHNPAHLPAALAARPSRIYVNYSPGIEKHIPKHRGDTEIFLALPPISRNQTEKELANLPQADGYLASNYGQLQLLQHSGKKIQLNHSFNIFNSHSAGFFAGLGHGITLSQELNLSEINALAATGYELIIYGRQTLMHTHNCPIGNFAAKKTGQFCSLRHKGEGFALKDRTGTSFPILTGCHSCIAHILNSKTLNMVGKMEQLTATAAAAFRLVFTIEDENTMADTIAAFQKAMKTGGNAPDISDFTYGHFFRGVDL